MQSQDDKKKDASIKVVDNTQGNTIFTIEDDKLPPQFRNLPVFPTRDIIVFPATFIVMTISDKQQIQVITRAMREKEHMILLPIRPSVRGGSRFKADELSSYYNVATYVRIIKISHRDENGPYQVSMRGIQRVAPVSIAKDDSFEIYRARSTPVAEEPLAIIGEAVYDDHNLLRTVRQYGRKMFDHPVNGQDPKEIIRIIDQTQDAGLLADFLAGQIDMPFEQRAELLCETNVRKRLQNLLDIMIRQFEVARLVADVAQKVKTDLDKQQRDYFLRAHIKALKEQIGEEPENDTEELKKQIEAMDADQVVIDYCLKQWKRLSYMPQASAEYSVGRSHIETLLDMPWHKHTEDHINLHDARQILDEDHYGLEDVKARVLEYLAVISLKKDLKAPILCLYGPPGVGKTSIGKSVARALGRKFERISLGGIHDESEIRGHRRTYVASMPGRIVQALRRAQTMNPVIMLDEIDKLAHDIHGDPSSALLEVLDPEQNHAFVDNYIETPIDLSQVLFMTTANTLDTIPQPLRDRMEIIEIHGYTHVDKMHIATEHLIPKLLGTHGILKSQIAITDEALGEIISNYTREAGVRQLEQRLAAVCRKVAAKIVEGREEGKKRIRVSVTARNLENFIGKKKFEYDTVEKSRMPGISTGLAWTQYGGDILFIETTDMPGKGNLVLTGQLGDVMQESIRAAMTLIRSHAKKLGLDAEYFSTRDVHVHVPAGATPKDGPSAGVAIFTALLSLFKSVEVPGTLAMTGEISLRGNVLPVGGIREKVLAAHRAGIRTIILPQRNVRDLDDVPQAVRDDIQFHPVSTIDEVIDLVFG